MSIEAMKQALEALEKVTKELLAIRDEIAERGGKPTTNVFHQRLWDSSFNAYINHAMPAAQSLRQAIAEAEQEKPLCTAEMFDKWFLAKSGLDPKTPLYTHPQPRKPLTADEVWRNDELMSLNAEIGCSLDLLMEVVETIEAAHGIKE